MEDLHDANLLRAFSFQDYFRVEVNAADADDHVVLIDVFMKHDDGSVYKAVTLCSCHARELAELLEKAADFAERVDEGTA